MGGACVPVPRGGGKDRLPVGPRGGRSPPSEYKKGVSDTPPPPLPPAAHPAPPTSWRPLSGLALSSFIAALILALFSAVSGTWIGLALPLVLGVLTWIKVDPRSQRGRPLAVWAILISLVMGSCSWVGNNFMRSMATEMSESILNVLSFSKDEEDRLKSLRAWTWPKALEADAELHAKWIARFVAVTDELGPWKERIELPASIKGPMPLFQAPDDVVEVGTKDVRPVAWTVGSVIWVEAVFEKGNVDVALVLKEGSEPALQLFQDYKPGETWQIVGDIRFYRPRADKSP